MHAANEQPSEKNEWNGKENRSNQGKDLCNCRISDLHSIDCIVFCILRHNLEFHQWDNRLKDSRRLYHIPEWKRMEMRDNGMNSQFSHRRNSVVDLHRDCDRVNELRELWWEWRKYTSKTNSAEFCSEKELSGGIMEGSETFSNTFQSPTHYHSHLNLETLISQRGRSRKESTKWISYTLFVHPWGYLSECHCSFLSCSLLNNLLPPVRSLILSTPEV